MTKRSNKTSLCATLLLLLAIASLTSCQKTESTHLFSPTHSDGWSATDSLTYRLPAAACEGDYQLLVELRIDNRYPYQDLWLVLDQTFQTVPHQERHTYTTVELKQQKENANHEPPISHHQHYRDTLHLQLTNGQLFNGSGRNLLVYRFPVRRVHLVRREQGTIAIHHIMDSDTIVGVHDVGIEFEALK